MIKEVKADPKKEGKYFPHPFIFSSGCRAVVLSIQKCLCLVALQLSLVSLAVGTKWPSLTHSHTGRGRLASFGWPATKSEFLRVGSEIIYLCMDLKAVIKKINCHGPSGALLMTYS